MKKVIKVLFLYPNLSMSSMVPLGIASLSAFLKPHDIDTAIFDTTFYTGNQDANRSKVEIGQVLSYDFSERGISSKEGNMFEDLKKMVEQMRPDLIAVSMVEDVFYLGINLLKAVKEFNIPNIVGGVFPTFAPEKVIREDVVDMICIGEGEEALLSICNLLRQGKSPEGVPNTWYKKDGNIQKNIIQPVVEIEKIPMPDYEIFPRELLYRPMQGKVRLTIGIETQRGCPFSCTFCNSPAQKKLYQDVHSNFYRRKPVEQIEQELDFLVEKYQPEFIYWIGDSFLALPPSEWDKLYRVYMRYRIPFWMNTRAETLTKERVKQLEEMNCMRCNIGIEHGNYDFRVNVLKRKVSDEQLIRGFKHFENSSITVIANNIIGFPGESEELIRETIAFNRKIAPYIDSASAFIFAPYHGTPLRQAALEQGYISDELIVNIGTTTGSLLNMPNLLEDKLIGLQRTFPLYVMLPKSFHADIKRSEELTAEGNAIFEKLLKVYQNEYLSRKKGGDWDDLH